MKKKILAFSIIASIVLLIWVQWNWNHLAAFPSILSSFYSKEFCSCTYVMNQSEEQCHNFARQWFPISEFEHDQANKEITVTGLGKTNKAKFVNERLGCVLVND